MRNLFHWHIRRVARSDRTPRWRDVKVIKTPMDLMLYAEVMWECRPDWVIETGTWLSGSALFFADMLKITMGKGRVITIDIGPLATVAHPFVEYVKGSSVDPAVVKHVADVVHDDKVMVVLDSDHRRGHVRKELEVYSNIVSIGQYMVVEDCYNPNRGWWSPKFARDNFLAVDDRFVVENKYDDKYLMNNSTLGGWLRRVK